MKQLSILLVGLAISGATFAQSLAVDSIEINTLKAHVYSDGGILEMETWDDSTYKPLLYADGIWVGGIDQSNTLHQSAQTYRQSGLDFWPGPISNNPMASSKHNRVYKVNLQTLTDFKNNLTLGVPPEIANWPAHGDTIMGEAYYLAPFVDVNNDGKYKPDDGDYPKIKGDEAIYTIFNDSNEDTTGTHMGLEIHCMVYAYNTGGIEDSIMYKEYKIINRSTKVYHSAYFSIFADFDLGNSSDDLIGTNISANSIFTYNSDVNDEGPLGFGTRLATCGLRMIQGPSADYFDGIDNDRDGCLDAVRDANGNCIPENPATGVREQILLSGSMYYNNTISPQGNPDLPTDYYNYMMSHWKDGNSLITENPSGLLSVGNGDGYVNSNIGLKTSFAYPGNSFDSTGAYPPYNATNWFDSPINLNDKRALANAGPFSISAGQEFHLTYAFIWSRQNDGFHGHNVINDKLANLHNVYNNPPSRNVGITKYQPAPNYRVYFDAINSSWFLDNSSANHITLELYDTRGIKLNTFSLKSGDKIRVPSGNLPAGVYIVLDIETLKTDKILVQ